MTNPNSNIAEKPTSIILCGGKERRFGRSKASACVGGLRVMDRVINVLAPLSHDLIVVTSLEKQDLPVAGKAKIVTDRYPSKGPLGGICTGLMHADSPLAIVVACDMPFLNGVLLNYMLGIADAFDAVIPRLEGEMLEPLHAVYAKSCLREMESQIERGELAIASVFKRLRVRYVAKAEYLPSIPECSRSSISTIPRTSTGPTGLLPNWARLILQKRSAESRKSADDRGGIGLKMTADKFGAGSKSSK